MPGEVGEGSAPISNSLKAQLEEVLEKAGVNPDPRLGLSNEVVGGLAIEGMEKDPRISAIKQELTGAWELLHGSRFDKDGVLRGDFQDYVYGNPTDLKAGKKPVSLDDRSRQVFRERFPDDTRAYDEQEKVRIYDDPNQDPALKAVEQEILGRTNTDLEVTQVRTKYEEVWTKVYNRFSMSAWNAFIRQYPEKAAAYKDRPGPLQQIFEGQERSRRYQEQQAQSAYNRSRGLEGNNTNQPGAAGGLSLPPDIGKTTQESPVQPQTPEQSRQFDPTTLLQTESMGLDDFFSLNRDEVYKGLHALAGTHRDQKVRERAQRIIDLIFAGKESYLQNNPGSTTINLT